RFFPCPQLCATGDPGRQQAAGYNRRRHFAPFGRWTSMDMNIKGLRVLVTAGASGIGLATARAFAAEGARVLICDVDQAALAAVAKSDPAFAQTACDVADPPAVAKLFYLAASELGGLDALVNNAGIAGPTAPCEEVSLTDWQRTLAVNITGQFLCAQHAIPMLKQSS